MLGKPLTDGSHVWGIPVKEARTYTVRQYTVEGTCTQADSSECHVVEPDLGQMILTTPDRFLEIRYRDNLLVPSELAIKNNPNSTLRSLSLQDSGDDHHLYFHFADYSTGVK